MLWWRAGRTKSAVAQRLVAAGIALAACGGIWAGWTAAYADETRPDGGAAQLPRFVSLKSNPVNLRKGPGTNFPKAWIFRRAGLPVEVIREHQRWREVRDSEGATGWVLRTLLSNRRTALVLPWDAGKAGAPLVSLRASGRAESRAVAMLEAGTLVGLLSCDGTWCYVSITDFRGYLEQEKLWGVYPREVIR